MHSATRAYCNQRTGLGMPEAVVTQLLFSVAFTCPFLLPSFFPRGNARAVRQVIRSDRWALPTRRDQKQNDLSGGEIWRTSAGKLRFTNIEPEHKIQRAILAPLAEIGTTCFRQCNLLQKPFTGARGSIIQQRQFTSATLISTRASPRKQRTPATKPVVNRNGPNVSRQGSKRLTSVRPHRKSIQSAQNYKSVVKSFTPPAVLRSSKSINRNKPISSNAVMHVPASTTKPSKASPSTQNAKLKPKWVKAGISRTKVKPVGRKARRTAKRAKGAHDWQTVEDKKEMRTSSNDKRFSLPIVGTEAYETAVLEGKGSWKKLLDECNSVKSGARGKSTVGMGRKKVLKTRAEGMNIKNDQQAKRRKLEDANGVDGTQQVVAPVTGSRISIRGDGRMERVLGKGRKVLGTAAVTPISPFDGKRCFGTWTGCVMEDKKTRSEAGNVEDKSEGSGELAEVKNTPSKDSEIPKSQISQTENLPINEKPQHTEAPRHDTEDLTTTPIATTNTNLQGSINDVPSNQHIKIDPQPQPSTNLDQLSKNESLDTQSPSVRQTWSKLTTAPMKSFPTEHTQLRSPLVVKILSSPNIAQWQKDKPEFWLEILRRWFLPQAMRPWMDETNPTIGGEVVKRLPVSNLFSRKYPSPILSERHIKLGAPAMDVIELLEESRRSGIDILVELSRQQEYSNVRWVVRRVLHPQVPNINKLIRPGVGDVLGSFEWDGKETSKDSPLHEAERFSVARAGSVEFAHIVSSHKDDPSRPTAELLNIQLARQGLGLVLGSIGTMLVYADPSTLSAELSTSFFPPKSDSPANERNLQYQNEVTKTSDYKSLLPISKEILAYLHNCSLVPSNLYSLALSPRLYILKTRILTDLADAVWRHQELAISESTNKQTKIEDKHSGAFSVSELDWKLHGYWRGGFETLTGDYPQWRKFWTGRTEDDAYQTVQKRKRDALRLEEMANRGEREVLLELVLRACILAGYGHAGSLVLSCMVSQGGWSWINYAATWPEEYRLEDVALREEAESTDGLPGLWGVKGYAVVPPPVRTIPKTLPQDLITGIAVSIVDSTAEGMGLQQVLSDIDRLGRIFGKEEVGLPALIPKIISIWETQNDLKGCDAPTGERLLQFIQGWSVIPEAIHQRLSPGKISAELQIWYKVLQSYIDLEVIEGAERVWDGIEKRLRLLMPYNDAPLISPPGTPEYTRELKKRAATYYFHPPWVLGSYLTILHRNRRVTTGLSLLLPKEYALFPVVPKHYYHLPALTPPLIALATLSKDPKLLNDIISGLPFKVPGGVPHTTLTSILNAYLRAGDFRSTQQVIAYIQSQQLRVDGVDVAVIIENTLRRDKEEGYRLVNRIVEHGLQTDPIQKVSPSRWVRSEWGSWQLPFKAVAGKGTHDITTFEGQKIQTRIEPPKGTVPPAKMSPSAWLSVLNHAVESNDRARTETALKALGFDLRRRNTLSTKVFNILLKGVVMRSGALQGWEMVIKHCVCDRNDGGPRVYTVNEKSEGGSWTRSTGRGREWEWIHAGKDTLGVRADVITFRTVLDAAVKERDKIVEESKLEWWRFHENEGWGEKGGGILQEQLQGHNLLGLLDIGLHRDKSKSREEQLQAWKDGMMERKKQSKDIEHVITLCRTRLNKLTGL